MGGSKCASFSVSESSYTVKEMGCNKFHLQTSLQCQCVFIEHLLGYLPLGYARGEAQDSKTGPCSQKASTKGEKQQSNLFSKSQNSLTTKRFKILN